MHCSSVAWGDYDNDGWLDLLVSGEVEPFRHAFLYHNNGDGSFSKVTTGAVVTDVGEGRTCAFVDYDRDGFLDIWVARTFGYVNGFYRNNGNSNGWIDVKCEGRVSNRAGIGAKIRVRAIIGGKDFWQLRQITALENIAHFGLGDASKVTAVRVEWPSGIVEELTDVVPKQLLRMREPSRLGIVEQADGSVSLALTGAAGTAYGLEVSTNLIDWRPRATVTNSSRTQVIDWKMAVSSGPIFYRATEQP